jgi:DNA polymerase III epsilon subunit-like protein
MTWKDDEWLSIDLETTGPDPDTAHPVEIGLVWMRSCNVVKSSRWLVKPPMPIPAEATQIHKISDADVVNQPTLDEYAVDLLDAVRTARVVVAYNGFRYDFPILSRLIPGFRDACKGRALLDPLTLVRTDDIGRYWKGQGRHRLTSVAERIGVPGMDPEKPHGAVYDAEVSAKVLWYFRDYLPDDGAEAQRYLVRQFRKQDEDFKRYLASKAVS